MAEMVHWTIHGLLGLAILTSVVVWIRVLIAGRTAPSGILESLVPVQPRHRPFWSPADFLVMYGALIVLSIILKQTMVYQGWMELPDPGDDPSASSLRAQFAKIGVNSIAGISGLVVTFAWLRLCNRNWWRELALGWTRKDVALGVRGALMILPPVLLIAALVSYFEPYHHDVLSGLAESHTPGLFLAMVVSTAVLTPCVEEFMFRVLLQGGLQGIADRQVDENGSWRPASCWPIIATSVVFSWMHMGQGAAYIPLFFFSLAVGFLYRQTGRVAASVVVHMILNGLTLCTMYLELQFPK